MKHREFCDFKSTNVVRGRLFLLTMGLSFASFCSSSVCAIAASRQGISSAGIDVILLIDVSGSMANKSGRLEDKVVSGEPWEGWNGSDPDRMRWDAVKLLVDLLDSHDRVLIKRFNEACPARLVRPEEKSGIPQVFPDGKPFVDAKQDFPQVFTPCGDKSKWEALTGRIGQFNRRLKLPKERASLHEDAWTLDQGGTNIIAALESLTDAIADEPMRPKRVILLTDGCDADADTYVVDPDDESPKINAKLAAKLSMLKRANVPVFTVGLKLDSISAGRSLDQSGKRTKQITFVKIGTQYESRTVDEPHFQQAKARAFLDEISDTTGGEFVEAKQATELLPLYLNIIYRLKGLWQKTEDIRPHTKISIPISSAVADFRMLAFVTPKHPTSTKAVTRPPLFAVGSESWIPSNEAKGLDNPQLRQGTEERLYALWYGGNIDSNKNDNPFALIEDEVRWNVPIPNETDPVATTQFKRVPEEFGWPPPEATYYRHQRPTISLLAAKDLLNAQDFEWRLFSDDPNRETPRFREDENFGKLMQATFVAGAQVADQWKPSAASQEVEWKLVGHGIKPKHNRSPVLDGFKREFSKWNFVVKNELPIRFRERLDSISLSLKQIAGQLEIVTQFAGSAPEIPMKVKFVPPAVTETALPLPYQLFRVRQMVDGQLRSIELDASTGEGTFKLIDGSAALHLELNVSQKALLPAGAEFSPGELLFKPADGDLQNITELKLPVELAIDRPILQFFKKIDRVEPLAMTHEAPTTGIRRSQTVFVAPKDDSGKGDKVIISLAWINHPIDPDLKKIPFKATEFRLCDINGTEFPREGDVWTTKYADRPIPIVLETHLESERLAESLAEASLVAAGAGFTKGTIKLDWKFKPREVAIKVVDSQTPEVEPGQVATFLVAGMVTNHTDSIDINLTEALQASGIAFRRTDKPASGHDFFVTADKFRKIKAVGTADKDKSASMFVCRIPETVDPGLYEATVSFEDFFKQGSQRVPVSLIPSNELTLKLIVDRLQIEVFSPNKNQWIPAQRVGVGASEFTVYGKLESITQRKLRVTSVLQRPFNSGLRPTLQSRYGLSTDAGRQSLAKLELRPISGATTPEWEMEFPRFSNRDKNFPFVAEMSFDRNQNLQQKLRLKFRLLPQ